MNVAKFKGKIIAPLKDRTNELTPLEFRLEVKRNSGIIDYIPIITDEIPAFQPYDFVEIIGELRTMNLIVDSKRKLLMYVLPKKISVLENEEYENHVKMQTYICKPPTLRQTPLTNRTISDCILANNSSGASNYIPSIAFQENAKFLSEQKVGTELNIEGRLQSRNYEKVINGIIVKMTTYELCVTQMQSAWI